MSATIKAKFWGGPYHNEWKEVPEMMEKIVLEIYYDVEDVFNNSFSPVATYVTGSHVRSYIRDPDLHAGNIVYYYKET